MQLHAKHLMAFMSSLLTLCTGVGLGAQSPADTLTYSGNYRLGGLIGQVDYDYRLSEGDTVMNGGFEFTGAKPTALLAGTDSSFTARGSLVDGLPTDRWRIEFGEYSLGETAEVINYHYRVDVNGIHREAIGNLSEGRLDGEWTQEVHRIQESELTDVLFRSEVTFAGGIPQQSFRLESGENILLGRFKRNGLAHDVWTFYDGLQGEQDWHFRDGRLERIELRDADTTSSVAILGAEQIDTTRVNLDERYLRFLSAWQRIKGGDASFTEGPVAKLLTENALAYRRSASLLEDLGASALPPFNSVVVPSMPLSDEETARLNAITDAIKRIDTVATTLDANTAFTVLESTDEEVAYLRAALAELRGPYLAPIRELTAAYADDILKLLPRDLYYADLFPQGSLPTSLDVTYESVDDNQAQTFDLPSAEPMDIGENGLVAIERATAAAVRGIDSIKRSLANKLDTKERRRVITALDEQLMQEFRLLDSLVKAQEGKVPDEYGLGNIRVTVRRQLQAYADNDDLVGKQEQARELTRCITELNALAITISRLPDRSLNIEELYTDQVWNNFTSTVMEENVKKRITEAYQERLVPYFQQQVRTTLSCQKAHRINTQLNALHERMLELRQRDTDELEDQLKDTDDPQEILNLLGVSA